MMTRHSRRIFSRVLVLLIFCIFVLLILVKSKAISTKDASQDYYSAMREASIENNERIARVKEVCKTFKMGPYKTESYEVEFKEPPVPQYSVFYIDRRHNISYCPIYKAASTTWIHSLCLLNGVSEEEILSGKEQISVIARRIMPELDYPEADELLNKTAKLVIVRHPFERLLSAYRDKLENSVAGREHGTLHFYKRYGESIVRKYRDKSRPSGKSSHVIRRPGVAEPAGIEPSWREFVDYLIDADLANYGDDHWMPYYLYCTPCSINYDFIAKVETLERDQAFAIHQLGLADKVRPRWSHRSDAAKVDAARVYFGQLTRRHVRRLHEKFRLDLELFGYSADRYYELATATH